MVGPWLREMGDHTKAMCEEDFALPDDDDNLGAQGLGLLQIEGETDGDEGPDLAVVRVEEAAGVIELAGRLSIVSRTRVLAVSLTSHTWTVKSSSSAKPRAIR